MSRGLAARTVAGLLRARAEATPERFGFYHKQQGEFVGWTWGRRRKFGPVGSGFVTRLFCLNQSRDVTPSMALIRS